MSTTLLADELTHLITESKRRNADLRSAAEKSLQELKALPATSEQQIVLDLSRRPNFIEPFILACNSRNPRYVASGVSCLQRLIVSQALPKTRLQDALNALNACTDLGLDVQLKVLQALPSLLQNYGEDLKGDLLGVALQACASLQAANVPTVSGVAAATLQQLISSVFDSLVNEDRHPGSARPVHEVPGSDRTIQLLPAAFDVYRVFRDLVLCAEGRKTKFVQLDNLPPEAALDLISACVNGYPKLFATHAELLMITRANLLQAVITGISENPRFSVAVRLFRILDLLLRNFFFKFTDEFEVALGLLNHCLELEASPQWKRALVMETLQRAFLETHLVIDFYTTFDQPDGGKPIVQDIIAAFVRLSSEKPSVIGLGQQSSVPTGPANSTETENEQSALEAAGGMAGIISSALGVVEVNISGISDQWSMPRVTFLEQVDKADPLPVPETYIYSLVLSCLNNLSEGLAKIVLPLAVPREKPNTKGSTRSLVDEEQVQDDRPITRTQRSQSFRKRAVPLNPLDMESHATYNRVRAVACLVDSCWPGILATSSTFFNAALDDRNYRALIKAFQRFAQVAGLLRLTTPRDALVTLLGKLAVPPHLLNAAMVSDMTKTPTAESPRIFSNPRSLLSVDSLVSQASSLSLDKERRSSIEPTRPGLTVRNLLCLRALLNLAIALGPTMDSAFVVVVDTLKQADMVLSSTNPHQMARQSGGSHQKGTDTPLVVQAFAAEVNAVGAAASRLLESTSDYPNEAFMAVLSAFLRLLHGKADRSTTVSRSDDPSSSPVSMMKMRTFSGLPGISSYIELRARDYQFVIPKLSHLAILNTIRFVTNDPAESGWSALIAEFSDLTRNASLPQEARQVAAVALCNMSANTISEVSSEDPDTRAIIQRRSFAVLLRLASSTSEHETKAAAAETAIQSRIVEAVCNILEHSGEALVAGWNKCIAILSCAFKRTEGSLMISDEDKTAVEWDHIANDFTALSLGRVAFGAIQIICSDFLRLIPHEAMPSLIELLHRFTTQTEDLNIALTSVTMAWNLLDFLFDESSIKGLAAVEWNAHDEDFEKNLRTVSTQAKHGQWLLVLSRLRAAIRSSDEEVRKAAFQTMCSVFRNHGQHIPPQAWDLVLRSIIFRVMADDICLQMQKQEDGVAKPAASSTQDSMSKVLLSGLCDLITQNVNMIEQIDDVSSMWHQFAALLRSYLALTRCSISATVFEGLSKILSNLHTNSALWEGALYPTASLWSGHLPTQPAADESSDSNQEFLEKYADVGTHIYRLTKEDINVKQTTVIVDNLLECLRRSDGPLYSGDANNMSPLQLKVMNLFATINRDIDGMSSFMVEVASGVLVLPMDKSIKNPKPTFLALAAYALEWMQGIILSNVSEKDFLFSASLEVALANLALVIQAKYTIAGDCRGLSLWRRAEGVALAIAKPLFDSLQEHSAKSGAGTAVLVQFISILQGIILASGLGDDVKQSRVEDDENFDIHGFETLRDMILLRLDDAGIADEVIFSFAKSLFDASIIHQPEPVELQHLPQAPLRDIYKLRRGRLKHVACNPRERMAYVCFSEMLRFAPTQTSTEGGSKFRQIVTSFLILRIAIPIRAYIVDQPLRGFRPKPLAEVEELTFCFQKIGELPCKAKNPDDAISESGLGENRVWAEYLYPLLIKAMNVASDKRCGSRDILEPLQFVLEKANPLA
ncbi:hypothetical protein K431DRAFT_306656 [Polychaeton citri CBS 116435]|uniref:Endosomal peripheral membrane protein n=1 Tax=Polychaeton citri CBS 116435 TaxID=1314669 RepID=A0A9P4UM96_9PEZI|nr:hypothetical protein K431DRAFT_306656 [Polychaeton citri CBS 116435]